MLPLRIYPLLKANDCDQDDQNIERWRRLGPQLLDLTVDVIVLKICLKKSRPYGQ
jgi:hypothetical protein